MVSSVLSYRKPLSMIMQLSVQWLHEVPLPRGASYGLESDILRSLNSRRHFQLWSAGPEGLVTQVVVLVWIFHSIFYQSVYQVSFEPRFLATSASCLTYREEFGSLLEMTSNCIGFL